jgi:hypothetical protein
MNAYLKIRGRKESTGINRGHQVIMKAEEQRRASDLWQRDGDKKLNGRSGVARIGQSYS